MNTEQAISSPPAAPERSGAIAGIEVLRGLAALAVLCCHLAYLGAWHADEQAQLLWFLASSGWAGVDLFFVISGFVITRSALRLRGERGFARRFWSHRFTRIYPLYLLTAVVYLLVIDPSPLTGPDGWFQLWTHLFMLHPLFPTTSAAINPVTWTLGIELALYAIAFVLMATRILHSGNARSIFVLGLALVLLYRLAIFHLCTEVPARTFYTLQMPGMMDGFLLGSVFAVFPDDWLRKRLPPTALVLLVGVLAAICGYWLHAVGDTYWQQWYSPVLLRSLLALCCGAVLLWSLHLAPNGLCSRLFRPLGEISYGIYLWHHMVIVLLVQAGFVRWQLLAPSVLVTLLLAWLSYRCFERPIQRALRARLG